MKKIGDYYNLYLNTDVLLLADIFEKFIDMCLEYYGFDSCDFFSRPRLSWDAILKMTGIEWEFVRNWHVFTCWKGIRGGVYYITKRHSKANNKYMEFYDDTKQVNISCI